METADFEKLVEYYVNLLIIQYHNKPKARATVRAYVYQMLQVYSMLKEIEYAYTIEGATGKQLDIVGKYFGVSRNYFNLNFRYQYFSFQYMGGDDEGLSFRTIKNQGTGKTLTLIPEDTFDYRLSDEQYRQLIQLRIIALHNAKLSYKYIHDQVYTLLKGKVNVKIDWQDHVMRIDYYFQDTNLESVFYTYRDLLPAPAGVQIGVYDAGELVPEFTLMVLPRNGGVDYSLLQSPMQTVQKPLVGQWRVIEGDND